MSEHNCAVCGQRTVDWSVESKLWRLPGEHELSPILKANAHVVLVCLEGHKAVYQDETEMSMFLFRLDMVDQSNVLGGA